VKCAIKVTACDNILIIYMSAQVGGKLSKYWYNYVYNFTGVICCTLSAIKIEI
jgi:hypothetical protein